MRFLRGIEYLALGFPGGRPPALNRIGGRERPARAFKLEPGVLYVPLSAHATFWHRQVTYLVEIHPSDAQSDCFSLQARI